MSVSTDTIFSDRQDVFDWNLGPLNRLLIMMHFFSLQNRVMHLLLQFGIEDLKACPDKTSCWDGVRNYQVSLYIHIGNMKLFKHLLEHCFISCFVISLVAFKMFFCDRV